MGSKAQAESSRNFAAFMKAKGITRRTGQCPIGASHTFAIGRLSEHLLTCPGPRRKGSK